MLKNYFKLALLLFLSVSLKAQNESKSQTVNIFTNSFNLELDSCAENFYKHIGNSRIVFSNLKFKGSLLKGISFLLNRPINAMHINGNSNRKLSFSFDLSAKCDFDLESTKSSILNYLETYCNFDYREQYETWTYECWKFVVIDSTKLPLADLSKINYNDFYSRGDRILSLNGNSLSEIDYILEMESGYYVDVTDLKYKSLKMNIPIDNIKNINEAKIFFKQFGIDIIPSFKEAKAATLTFF